MGAVQSREQIGLLGAEAAATVTLHVYDLEKAGTMNALLRPMGTGAYHCGVQIFGWEWSYGSSSGGGCSRTGIFTVRPGSSGQLVDSIVLGSTPLSQHRFFRLMSELEAERRVVELQRTLVNDAVEWPAKDYDIFLRNCASFCDALCRLVGVGGLPAWVKSLPEALGAVRSATIQAAGCRGCRPSPAICCAGGAACCTGGSGLCSKRHGLAADGGEQRSRQPVDVRSELVEVARLPCGNAPMHAERAGASGPPEAVSAARRRCATQSPKLRRQIKL
ncbi:unnamed protein product [Prorocentrum cordatum]|uniref:PPPDE domain-containing protein n=1 Tax=Prorocentrum cordatum TaxID=2364126 RepID=A0ABN9S8X1_9DINO|nr:unnamed protein product [Polarella glacialis]